MADKYCIFVDVDSLNVLYKCGDKFVAALSYSTSLDRLGETLPALGAGFDIYLCMKPRAPGEGDLVIDELSITGLPFTVDSEELYHLLRYFRDYQSFGEVYLCNWVNNYIQSARVQTFKSVVYYGDRVALIGVKDSILEEFKLYSSQREFEETDGRSYTGYGDVGLIDIDGFKAQYPEFATGSKPQLAAVAPLVHSYRTSLRMETGDLFEKLKKSRVSGEKFSNTFVEREFKPVIKPDDPGITPTAPLPEPEPEPKLREPVTPMRKPVPVITKLLMATTCILAIAFGVCAGIVVKDTGPVDNTSYFNQVQSRIVEIQEMASVYQQALTFTSGTSTALRYCQDSEVAITILGFEHFDDQYIVRYSCVSEDDCQQFVNYVSNNYLIVGYNSLGVAEVEGQTVLQYTLTFS